MRAAGNPSSKVQQQKSKECTLYGFLVQPKPWAYTSLSLPESHADQTPHAKLLKFCSFLLNNSHPKTYQVKFRDTMAIYHPKEKTNYYKVGHLITHQKVAKSVDSEETQIEVDEVSDAPTAIQSDIERASADLTGCSGVYSVANYLKLFSDQLEKVSSINVTIKKCKMLKAAPRANPGETASELSPFQDPVQKMVPQQDASLQFFAQGSGFSYKTTKLLIGDEFKFVLNDYPDVFIGKNSVAPSALKTVKMRIYKIYVQKSRDWEEHEILRDIFEVGSDSEHANNQQQPLDEGGYQHDDGNNYGGNGYMIQPQGGYPQDPYGMHPYGNAPPYIPHQDPPSARSIHQDQYQLHPSMQVNVDSQYHQVQQHPVYPDDQPMQNEESKQDQGRDDHISKLDLYQVELTGMCTDTDQKDYSEMIAKFARKFSSFVELSPMELASISGLNAQQ